MTPDTKKVIMEVFGLKIQELRATIEQAQRGLQSIRKAISDLEQDEKQEQAQPPPSSS